MRPRAPAPVSTKTTVTAPRDRAEASGAGAGNRSTILRPSRCGPRREAMMLNSASRTRSAVGRMDHPPATAAPYRELAGDDAHQALGGRGRRGRSPSGPDPRGTLAARWAPARGGRPPKACRRDPDAARVGGIAIGFTRTIGARIAGCVAAGRRTTCLDGRRCRVSACRRMPGAGDRRNPAGRSPKSRFGRSPEARAACRQRPAWTVTEIAGGTVPEVALRTVAKIARGRSPPARGAA